MSSASRRLRFEHDCGAVTRDVGAEASVVQMLERVQGCFCAGWTIPDEWRSGVE